MATKKETMEEELARLRAENSSLKNQEVTFKIGEKGGLSVYGLGRFPVTLYKEQWEKLLSNADAIKTFIKENSDKLKTKGK